MTAPRPDTGSGFETQLTRWLTIEAPAVEPLGALEELLAVTVTTPQARAGSRRAWLPMAWPSARWQGLRRSIVVAVALATLLSLMALLAGMLRPAPLPRDGLVAVAIDGDVWVAEADGSGPRILVGGPARAWSPLWSPDGERLAYLETADGATVVRIVSEKGQLLATLRPPDGFAIGDAATVAGWSPDGAELTVPVVDDNGRTQVAIFEVDRDMASVPDVGEAYTFGWSPDGRLLGIKALGMMAASTQVVDAGGRGEPRTVVPDARLVEAVAFTPDSAAVLFSQQSGARTFDGDIVTVGVEDGAQHTLVGGPANDVSPAFSPDGTHLAFHRSPRATIGAAFGSLDGEDPATDLHLMANDGVAPVLLARSVAPSSSWSPSGARIAAFTPDARTLLLIPADGSGVAVEVALPGPASSISWQPLGP
jgi:Tol biopolymer transport system component